MTRKRLPVARAPWALDSGGFTELTLYGEWRTSPTEYAADVRRYRDEIGHLAWAAQQDWMVEPFMLEKTGLTVAEHQRRTTENYLILRALEAPVIPVLQGWTLEDYLGHLDQFARAGIDLAKEPLVGLGSVCRRQNMAIAAEIIYTLACVGLRLHGFGLKLTGLRAVGHYLASADSMAWSFTARRTPIRLEGCVHQNCANCLRYALLWRDKVCQAIATPKQERFAWESA